MFLFKELIILIINKYEKKIFKSEKKFIKLLRRSLYFKDNFSKGHKIKKSDICFIRPYNSNALAPEHLELAFSDVDQYVDQVTHAGSVFVGVHTTESFGDYCSGTNHVLPTSGSARFSSPLGVHDFQKRTSFTRCSQQGANFLGPVAATMARAEHLEAHALAAESRVEKG